MTLWLAAQGLPLIEHATCAPTRRAAPTPVFSPRQSFGQVSSRRATLTPFLCSLESVMEDAVANEDHVRTLPM